MKVQRLIEILKQRVPEKEVVIDNCDGSVSLLLQVAELQTDDKPSQHYIALVFDDEAI